MTLYQKKRAFIAFMLVLTGLYLFIEMSFNARLLDVAGTLASPEEIETVEIWGRCISGLAVVLAFFGFFAHRAMIRQWSQTKFLLYMMACLPLFAAVYYGEKAFVDYLVDNSTGAERKASSLMLIVRDGLLTDKVKLESMDLNAESLKTPEGKTFSALLPFFGSGVEKLASKTGPAIKNLAREKVLKELPSPNDLYKDAYGFAITETKRAYNKQYIPGTNKYNKSLADIPAQQDKYWREFKKELSDKRLVWPNIHERYHRKIAETLRSRGIKVSLNWKPTDRTNFYEAIEHKINRATKSSFISMAGRFVESPEYLKPGLEWKEFYSSASVQATLKKELTPFFDGWSHIPQYMSPNDFLNKVYLPWREKQIEQAVSKIVGPDETYESGGVNEETGKSAFRSTIAPPIALFLSLAGAVVHILKTFNYLLMLVVPARVKRFVAVTFVALALGSAPIMQANIITESKIFQILDMSAKTFGDKVLVFGVEWTVKAQPFVYPLTNMLRNLWP